MEAKEVFELMIFNYYVIYKTDQLECDYQPIVYADSYDSSQTMHILDNELNNNIPALWYILHLPRMGFDVIENDIELTIRSHDEPHNIIVLPYNKNSNFIVDLIQNPTLIICEDDIYEDIISDQLYKKSLLGIKKISELNSELLNRQWKKLSTIICNKYDGAEECIVDNNFRLTTENERKILPLIPRANQLGYTYQLIKEIRKINLDNNYIRYASGMQKRILHTFNSLAEEDDEFMQRNYKDLIENPNLNGVPLVITMPGIIKYQAKRTGRVNELPKNEEEIISIMGYHRAMAKNAIYFSLPAPSHMLFELLWKLEDHCRSKKPKDNKFVWNTLINMGEILNTSLEKFGVDILENVSQITVFSDFPIGLAILPGCSAPLCCIKPITYRTLSPLTRAFQTEIMKSPQIYFGRRLKILIAECVDKNDSIRGYCDGLTQSLKKMIKNYNDVELVVQEISSINQFKEVLKIHSDANILLVSAHGTYQAKTNIAGLNIGGEIWMANDNDIHVPPVVLLSACHVMPRGSGVVSVGDLFMRAGATAVLGTFIPIDVRRNAMLIVRLFTYIFEVRDGWGNIRTLDQIWRHVVGTNAIHEIIGPIGCKTSKLEIWANTPNKKGEIPQQQFKNKSSANTIRYTHVYEDTERILREMAYEDGIGEYYDSYISATGYFPESVFYQFIGMPENIFIRNSVMKKYNDM